MPTPEFSRNLDITEIPPDGTTISLTATRQELSLIAARLRLPAIHALTAEVTAEPSDAGGYRLHGTIAADVEHECVVSLDLFHKEYDVEFERRYVESEAALAEDENTLDPLCDDEPDLIADGKIDIGELVVESLALVLDPYPRKPGTTFEPLPSGDKRDPIAERVSPFAVLDTLKQRK